MVVDSTRRRPIRSPSGPNTSPPSGRTRKATAKVANVETTWVAGLSAGKKTLPRVTAT